MSSLDDLITSVKRFQVGLAYDVMEVRQLTIRIEGLREQAETSGWAGIVGSVQSVVEVLEQARDSMLDTGDVADEVIAALEPISVLPLGQVDENLGGTFDLVEQMGSYLDSVGDSLTEGRDAIVAVGAEPLASEFELVADRIDAHRTAILQLKGRVLDEQSAVRDARAIGGGGVPITTTAGTARLTPSPTTGASTSSSAKPRTPSGALDRGKVRSRRADRAAAQQGATARRRLKGSIVAGAAIGSTTGLWTVVTSLAHFPAAIMLPGGAAVGIMTVWQGWHPVVEELKDQDLKKPNTGKKGNT